MSSIERSILPQIAEGLKQYPIVALTGPRQSGKTTLLKKFFPEYRYVSLENPDIREFAISDAASFLNQYADMVILDEVQRVPQLFSYLQTLVDDTSKMGQFILSGSQNFQLMESITQSLAGRVALFKLLPFDSGELQNENLLPSSWEESVVKGFYPAIYDRGLDSPRFYSNYVQTYVQRDVAMITNVQDKSRFTNFLGLCAAQHGQLLNLSSLAKKCGISQPTAKSWLSIMESSYLIFLLQPYYENYSKRIVKSPKLYFYDTGLLAYLLGIRQASDFSDQAIKGSLFENLAIAERVKRNFHENSLHQYWFWRDSAGKEVDLLKKTGLAYDIYEVKSTSTISNKLVSHLHYFDKLTDGAVRSKTLIYGGDESQKRSEFEVMRWYD